jgi:hypothetical protein
MHDHDHDHDHAEWLDDATGLCVYPPATFLNDYNGGARGPMPLDANVPAFASLPAANHTIYLDFNGHTTTGTNWTNNVNSGAPIVTPAYDVDGNPADFSTDEQNRIRDIWKRVSEDYAPFNVNVTTVEPPAGDLIKSGGGDTRWGVRVAIGGRFSDWYGSSAGGVAYLTSFNYSSDTPCFVFADTQGDDVKSVAEATSHEVGHTLGLSHDGRTSPAEGYYYGHGSGVTGWAPIMGVGYNRSLVQWSKGQYTNANNTQDDLAIITTANGFGYRTDDHGNTNAGATTVTGTSSIAGSGIIANSSDRDVFKFAANGGSYSFTLNPYELSPNLDVKAQLYNATGTLLSTASPTATLSATLTTTLTAGVYYLHLLGDSYSGTGTGSPTDTGYTTYGSQGQFTFSATGSFADPSTNSVSGSLFEDWNGNGLIDTGDADVANATVYVDTNNNNALDSGEQSTTTDANGNYALNAIPSGTRSLRAIAAGFTVTSPASGAQVVTLPATGGVNGRNFGFVRSGPGVYGRMYLDANTNGVYDAADTPQAGRTVYLDSNSNSLLDVAESNTVTDQQGNYYLTASVGPQTIRAVPGANYFPYSPANGAHALTLSTNAVQNLDFGVSVQPVPLPAVTFVTVNTGGAQRSRIVSVGVNFNSVVTLSPDAFSLRRISDNLTLIGAGDITIATTVVSNATVVTLTFNAGEGVDATSLADGVWQLRIDATGVSNSFGPMNADYLSATSGAGRIHRHFGDANGDGTVDGSEFLAFGNLFNSSDPTFDFDNNYTVSGSDLLEFGNRFGRSI